MAKRFKAAVVGIAAVGVLAVSGCTAGTGGGGGGASDGESVSFALPHVFPESSAVHEAATAMAERAPEVTDGRVNFEVYSNSQLGGDEELANSLVSGDAECAFFAASPSGLDPRLQLSFLPYIATDYEEADALYHDPEGVIQTNDREVLASHGITLIGFYENDFRGLTTSNVPVRAPEDMQGLKLRVPGMPMYISMFQKWGAEPVSMPFPELYTGLQQGTVDGQDNGIVLSSNSGFDEVQSYLTLTRHGYGTGHVACNTEIWESLSEEDREAIGSLAEEVSAAATESVRASVDANTEELREAGMEIIELSDEELAQFTEIRDEIWEENVETFGRETIDALRADVEALNEG